jgi:hypothetical protein
VTSPMDVHLPCGRPDDDGRERCPESAEMRDFFPPVGSVWKGSAG